MRTREIKRAHVLAAVLLVSAMAVMAPAARAEVIQSFTISSTGPALPDNAVANPYPSQVSVSGLTGTIARATAEIRGISHTDPADIDALLVGPSGQTVMLLSDACSTLPQGASVFLDDAGGVPVGTNCAGGPFKPVNFIGGAADDASEMPAPAPPGPYGDALSALNGSSPNGTWSLYARDDTPFDTGSIAGWSVTVAGPTPATATATKKTCKKHQRLKHGKCVKKKRR